MEGQGRSDCEMFPAEPRSRTHTPGHVSPALGGGKRELLRALHPQRETCSGNSGGCEPPQELSCSSRRSQAHPCCCFFTASARAVSFNRLSAFSAHCQGSAGALPGDTALPAGYSSVWSSDLSLLVLSGPAVWLLGVFDLPCSLGTGQVSSSLFVRAVG